LKWKAWQQHQLLLFVFMTCASPLAKASHAVGCWETCIGF